MMDKISINNSNNETDIVTTETEENNEQLINSVENNENNEKNEEETVDKIEISNDSNKDNGVAEFKIKMEQARSKRMTNKKRVNIKKLITFVITMAIIVLLTFFAYKGLYLLGKLILNDDQIISKSQEISITSTGTLDYERFCDGMLVANSGLISYLNSDLETFWENPGYEGIPVISQNG